MMDTARKNARALTEELFALQSQLAERQLEQSKMMEQYMLEALSTSRKNVEQTLTATNELNRKMMDLIFPAEQAQA
jgi:ribosomal protein L29